MMVTSYLFFDLQRLEGICSLAGEEEEEQELAWRFLEVLHFHLSDPWIAVEETDAREGG